MLGPTEDTNELTPTLSSVSPSAARDGDKSEVDTGSAVESAQEITKTQRSKQNHKQVWPWGNYRNYYNFRPASSAAPDASLPTRDSLDGRLALLPPSLFAGKTLLDLGTNSGKIPLDALRHLQLKNGVGVDIDPLLIQDSIGHAVGQGYKEEGDSRLSFLVGDCIEEGWFASFERNYPHLRPDIVTVFSVSKWMHLHNGDAGLRRLFSSLFSLLPRGGVVVIEPQEWENYKSAVKKNKDLRPTFQTLEMRPPFIEDMQKVGFKLESHIEREEGGFSRPLLVWRKE